MARRKTSKSKKKKIGLYVNIALIILIGIALALCAAYGISREWIGFGICLAAAIALIAIEIPIWYLGTLYECPNCKQKFKANPYKVFFTNGIFGFFNLDDSGSKYTKLKCPHCKTKAWCKNR